MKIPWLSTWREYRAEKRRNVILSRERAAAEWRESIKLARELGEKAARERHPAKARKSGKPEIEQRDVARTLAQADSYLLDHYYRPQEECGCRKT